MEISLLHQLVLSETTLELALLFFLDLYRCLSARKRSGGLLPFSIKVRKLRIERAQLVFDLADLEVVLLQREQCLNFLLHPTSG